MERGPLIRSPGPTNPRGGGAPEPAELEPPLRWPAIALAGILAVTAAWWALALWPTNEAAPEWLVRTRAVCFGAAPDGLPDGAGWAVLVGQPLIMLAILLAGWGRDLRLAIVRLRSRPAGRAALVAAGVAALAVPLSAGARVAQSTRETAPAPVRPATAAVPGDAGAPGLVLTDQTGERFDLRSLRGRPVLVTFAYGHCGTVCPTLVHEVLQARRRLAGADLEVVIVTLDPWRDTPARLPAIARRWSLDDGARLVGGPVERVEETLDAWRVSRQRDLRTGEIVHPRLVFVIDPGGRIHSVTSGGVDELVRLATRARAAGGPRSDVGLVPAPGGRPNGDAP